MADLDPNKMLADLATRGHTRSMIRRLQDYLPNIEQCVDAGYSLPAIHEWLVSAGFDISLKYFRTALTRLRKPGRRRAGTSLVDRQTTTDKRPLLEVPSSASADHEDVRLQSRLRAKTLKTAALFNQEDCMNQRNMGVSSSDRKTFEYDPTAAGRLDLKNF